MAKISADRFNDLKSKVKSECQRRSYSGQASGSKNISSTYGGTSYDYTLTPAVDKVVKQEHLDKNLVPLNAINSTKVPNNGQKVVTDAKMTQMEAFVTSIKNTAWYDPSKTDCSGGCSGLCYGCQGSCYDACTGCWGSCWDYCTGCTGSCTGDCTGTCTGQCVGCTGGCYGCGDVCSSGCGDGCTGGCAIWCTGQCRDDCWGGCSGGCSSNGCTNQCAASCAGSCAYNCTHWTGA